MWMPVITFEPVRSQLLRAGARELFSSRQIPGEIVDVLVVRRNLIQQRQRTLCHLLDSYYSALAELRKAPDRAAGILAGPENISPGELAAAWQLMQLPGRDEGLAMLRDGQAGLTPALNELQRVMLANRLLAREVDARALPAPQLIESCSQ
jgi:NitT/TauT family transport system substrate-binding protein